MAEGSTNPWSLCQDSDQSTGTGRLGDLLPGSSRCLKVHHRHLWHLETPVTECRNMALGVSLICRRSSLSSGDPPRCLRQSQTATTTADRRLGPCFACLLNSAVVSQKNKSSRSSRSIQHLEITCIGPTTREENTRLLEWDKIFPSSRFLY